MTEWADGIRRDRYDEKATKSCRKAQESLEAGNIGQGVQNLRKAADAKEKLAEAESRTKVAERHRKAASEWRELATDLENGDVSPAENTNSGSSKNGNSSNEQSQSYENVELDIQPETPDIDFDDVGGMDDLKQELQEKIAEPVSSSGEFASTFQISTVPGVLLQGPPGTGKTHITKALAGELDEEWSFINIKIDEMTSPLVGQGAKKIAAAFDTARKHEPSILFFDEIDSLAGNRADDTQRTQSGRQMLTTMLTQMSELDGEDSDVVVIGATNDPESVDPALRNPQRFSEVIEVPLPDAKARIDVLRVGLSEVPVDDGNIDPKKIASMTEGFSSSDMDTVSEKARKAAWHASREKGKTVPVNQNHIESAIQDRKKSLEDADKGGYLE
jgi:SpoVK/Ycf46/Vps4 family AAA+-type ATPase